MPVDPVMRHRVMASIRSRDTKPELTLRRALWALGVRGWRCHINLTGTPDVAFPRWRVAAFVDGVWWHGHPKYIPRGKRGPYWDAKVEGNRRRDQFVNHALRERDWTVVRLWDLEVIADPHKAALQVINALKSRGWKPY